MCCLCRRVFRKQAIRGKSKSMFWKQKSNILEKFVSIFQYPAAIGEDVVVSFDLESREFNGRWYTDVRAWKIEKSAPVAQGVPDMPPMPNDIAPFPPAPASPDLAPSPTDDLPF